MSSPSSSPCINPFSRGERVRVIGSAFVTARSGIVGGCWTTSDGYHRVMLADGGVFGPEELRSESSPIPAPSTEWIEA